MDTVSFFLVGLGALVGGAVFFFTGIGSLYAMNVWDKRREANARS